MAKLLIADANVDEADDLADALRQHGYFVRTAYSEQQCLKLFGEYRPAVVLNFLPKANLGKNVAVVRLKKPVDVRSVLRTVTDALP